MPPVSLLCITYFSLPCFDGNQLPCCEVLYEVHITRNLRRTVFDSHQDTEDLSLASMELSPINGNVSDFQVDLPPVGSSL